VTCYMGHMQWMFDALGIPDDKKNRKRVDAAIRQALAMDEGAHCPEIWAAIKALSPDERDALVPKVGDALEA